MRKSWVFGAAYILAAAVIIDFGCGQKSTNFNHPSPPPSPTPQSASTTIPLAANTALPIPPVAGFSGTFKESGGTLAGATVKLTSYVKGPSSAPAPLAVARGPSSAANPGTGNAIFLVSQNYSAPMTFPSFPSTTWTLPPSFATTGPFELETIDATTGLLLDTEYQTSLTGDVVSFPGNLAAFTTAAGHIYWWELIIGFASPPPPGCGSNVVSVTVSPAGQAVAQPTLCNFNGSLQISPNNAPSGVTMNVAAVVPAASGMAGPPVPAGTTTGLISVGADVVAQTVTFNSGFFGLTVRLPSSIPAAGKTFYVSACTIKATRNSRSGLTYLGCIDTPSISGPLPVTGQTVSIGGLSSALTLSASGAGGTCHKFCPPEAFYNYTAALYY